MFGGSINLTHLPSQLSDMQAGLLTARVGALLLGIAGWRGLYIQAILLPFVPVIAIDSSIFIWDIMYQLEFVDAPLDAIYANSGRYALTMPDSFFCK